MPRQLELFSNNSMPAASAPRRRPLWLWLWVVPLICVPFVLGSRRTASNASVKVPSQSQALPVNTIELERVNDYAVQRSYTGEVAARRTSNLGFERGGTVVELRVDDGDRVQAGAAIATLDTRDLVAQRQQLQAQKRQALARLQELKAGPRSEDIASAEAAVADLRNQLSLARLQQQRRELLYREGAIARETMEERKFSANALQQRMQQAQSQLDELRAGTRREQIMAQAAQVSQLEASLKAVDISLAKSVLKAPFSGKVSARAVDEGVVVTAGQTVFRLVESRNLEARIGLPSTVAARLAVGSAQTVEVNGRPYPARVTNLLPELDVHSRTVTAILKLTSGDDLTVGSTARLSFTQTETASGFWVPTTALVAGERGLWSVYVIKPDGDRYQAARRDVEVLHVDRDRNLIRGMVQPGEQIIAQGTHRIVPGQMISPQNR